MFSDKQSFIDAYRSFFVSELGREFENSNASDRFYMLAKMIAINARGTMNKCAKGNAAAGKKNVYYFSMEFLIGRLLENYLINMGIRDIVAKGLEEMDESLENLCAQERDPGLGNGGLGRLAACFIDSMASLGMAGHGNGIRYRYGLFRQKIENGCQTELPDNWLSRPYPWEVEKRENAVVVNFYGEVVRHSEGDKFWFTWDNCEKVLAVPYDVPVVGYGGETVNTLRLWSAEPYEDKFDMNAFNHGDYGAANRHRANVEAITQILYPNDNSDAGKVLRLKQEYLFVAAGLNNILNSYRHTHGNDWKHFPDYVAIHTNDTHPALCGPELMRLLVDEEHLDWDEAWDIVTRTVSYTNHTVLPEALEKWPIEMFRHLLPRLYMVIETIDHRYRDSFDRSLDNWQEHLRNTAILWDGQVRMANLSIICGHSVNGVAKIHTEILKDDVLKSFYLLEPEKFNNKTNGITHRRFLAEANPGLSKLITSAIGDGWLKNADELNKLLPFKEDKAFLEKFEQTKRENKVRLSNYIEQQTGVSLDPDSIFDIQVKRFHAYKRQLLNLLKVMHLYEELKANPKLDIQPASFIFAGKAAQGYAFAKDTIRLVNSVANVVNNDPDVNQKIKVAFVPNFSVSNAQLIYPAANISEQISTAGKEASGTGNMKFMLNGAITLGTFDGANVEISEQVGMENIEIFGLRVEDINELWNNGSYIAWDAYMGSPVIRRVVDRLNDGSYAALSGGFSGIYDTLLRSNDEFYLFKDFEPYVKSWHKLEKLYADRNAWNRIALHNVAKAGFFSSDRTIAEYSRDIWHAD